MAIVALKLVSIGDGALGDFAQNIIDQMTAKVGTFPLPSPTLAALQTATDNYTDAYQDSLDGGKTAVSLKDTRRKTLEDLLTQEAAYVDNIANGSKDTILSAGMPASKDREATPLPDAPKDVRATASAAEGEVKIQWKAVKSNKGYQVEISTDNISWTLKATVSKSPLTVGGLTPGSVQWFRVITLATNNRQSAPSDPARVRVG